MLKIIGIVVAVIVVLVVVLLLVAASKPDTMHVERSTSIKAPPEKIFVLINDFHKWGSWSPYEKLDPSMKKTYSGAESGKGAVYEWEGNSKAGKGRMEIAEASSPSKVTIKLDFEKPFEGHNVAAFTLDPKGDATNVTWSMDGPSPFPMKVMGIFLNLDNLIGQEFENGLANLKTVTEK
ncbi:MAG TPA: SRPBCC family protein [Isosphaeraceae bacterium]|jgi:carbon monoxide dehydrogenase subunit G|nr:SRPBCC family protein [Isosphaeraceae bacterium]